MDVARRQTSVRDATGQLRTAAREVKPHLRGWLHLGAFPLSLAAGVVLIVLAETTPLRIACAVFSLTASVLFGGSALYHRGTWSPETGAVLRRVDHANIFLLIAGTYTPLSVGLLDRRGATTLLILVWGGALTGILFRIFWLGAPRWLYVPIYVALGWAAIFWLGDFYESGGAAVLTLIAVGGGLYSLGAMAYAAKWPNPVPAWFGFHEVFHSFTLGAFTCHYIAISLVAYGVAG